MRIIGTLNRKYLVEADMDELAKLTGYQSEWYRSHEGKRKLEVGDSVDVDMLFKHSEKMRAIHVELVRAQGTILAIAEGLTLADNVIKAAVETPMVNEGQ